MTNRITFDFYGVTAAINLPLWLEEAFKKDFSYFEKALNNEAQIEISVSEEKPPCDSIPPLIARLYQPDSISYDQGDKRFVDYTGKAISIYDYSSERGEIFSADRNLLHELAYLMLLSRVGEILDKKGIHRVHACGFSINGKGILCLLPQGGGKTTLFLELMKNENVMLVSDDIPLLTRNSMLLPFPLRIGVSEGTKLDIPQEYLGSIERRKYGKKTLIDTRYLKGRISGPVKISHIFICEREFSDKPRILKIGKFAAYMTLIRDCVIGIGLPQMAEYFLRLNLPDILSKFGIVSSRKFGCIRAVFKAKTYRFIMGTDTARNALKLLEFIGR